MASTAGSTPLPTGCHKCGRTGHWSKDCTYTSGGGASGDRPPSTAGGFSGGSGARFSISSGFHGGNSWRGRGSQGNTTQGSKSLPKETIRKEPKKRPKLTADLLLSKRGLGYVLEKMPEMVTIKGREDTVVRDLKSLLEGYMHWHSLLLPYFSFDQFVDKVETVGATKRVRVCTRELRDKIVDGKGSTGDKDVEAEAIEGSAQEDTLPEVNQAGTQSEAHHGPPDDLFTNEEPELPVNDEDFEDFFRQGVVETSDPQPSSLVGGGSAPPGLQSNGSPVRKFPSLEEECSAILPEAAPSITLSESAAARMEANRLRALERAKARQAKNVCTRELREKIVDGKVSTGDMEVEAEANETSAPKDTLPEDNPAGPQSEAHHGPPDDLFINEEPELPVNQEDFEDFFKQGVVETSDPQPSSPVGGGSVPPGLQSNVSPVRKFPTLEGECSAILPEASPSVIISESSAARMETNRLRALERAKARQAKNVHL